MRYTRGAFFAYDSQNFALGKALVIPFWFNPDGLSRSFSAEMGTAASPIGEGADKKAADPPRGPSADAPGSVRETFEVKLRFDARERRADRVDPLRPFGLMPELAALESLILPPETLAWSKPGAATSTPQRLVLFAWGPQRIIPVRVDSLNVNEVMHDVLLNPVRAEVTVGLATLSPGDAKVHPAVRVLDKARTLHRMAMTRAYTANLAVQGGQMLPL